MRKRVLAGALILLVGLIGCKMIRSKYWFNKGNQLFKDNKYDKAIEMYDKAIAADPDFMLAHLYRGSSFLTLYKPGASDQRNKNRAEQAILEFERVLQLDENNSDSLLSLANLYDNLGDVNKAVMYYKRRITAHPDEAAGYYILADFYGKHVKMAEAEETYQKCIALNPQDPERYLYLANFYTGPSQERPLFDKAIEQHQKRIPLLQSQPDKLKEVYYAIGVTCWAKLHRSTDLTTDDRQATLKVGYDALDQAFKVDAEYPEAFIYKGLLMREEAALPGTPDAAKKEMISQAESCTKKGVELRKKRQAEAAAAAKQQAAAEK